MRSSELRKLLNRNAVTLALEYLVKDGCVGTFATGKTIAKAALRSVDVTLRTIRELEASGDVVRLDWRDNLSATIFVLMDRPGARAFVRETRENYGRCPGHPLPAPRRKRKGR